MLPRPAALALALAAAASPALAQRSGEWRLDDYRGRGPRDSVQLAMTFDAENNMSLPVPIERLRGLTTSMVRGDRRSVRFEIPAEAGTVTFTGRVGDESGSGEFRFDPNPRFDEALRARGVRGHASDFDLLRFTIRDTHARDVEALLAALRRYDDAAPDAGELIRLGNHRVDEAVVADLGAAGLRGLEPNGIIRLVNHGVDGRFVKEARDAGYSDLDPEQLIRLRNHGFSSRRDHADDWYGGKRKRKS